MQTNTTEEPNRALRTCHLFAGIGGGLLCDLILGHRPIVAVEWDKYACRILRERAADGWFPDLSVWEGDVRLFDPSEYAGRVDCIHAGFPCQDISVAGKQAGLGEGTRSGLYREVLRIVRVVNEIRGKQGLPAVKLFLENVSAILSNGLGTVLGDLAQMGYDCRWLCIRASDVGAPHGRDRWFALAYTKGAGIGREKRDIYQANGGQIGQMREQLICSSAESENTPKDQGTILNALREGCTHVDGRGAIPNEKRDSESDESRREQQQSWVSGTSELADTKRDRLQGQRENGNAEGQAGLCDRARSNEEQVMGNATSIYAQRQHNRSGEIKFRGTSWWETESCVGELADGVSDCMDIPKGIEDASNSEGGCGKNAVPGWWEVESDIGRVAAGVKDRVGMLKGLGNAQVPIQAAAAWRLLTSHMND